jgi:hypothetical protein
VDATPGSRPAVPLVDGIGLDVCRPETYVQSPARAALADEIRRKPVLQVLRFGEGSPNFLDGMGQVALVAEADAAVLA